MWKEFREFIAKGSVMDLAVGVVIGAAFGKIVTSLVNDVLMPPLGLVLGRVNFSELFYDLSRGGHPTLAAAREAGAPVIAYGAFANTLLEFLIIAFVIFLLVRTLNRMRRQAPAAAATTRECPQCCSAIPLAAKRCPACTSQLS
jgi:large conductance mechanosensitive channel